MYQYYRKFIDYLSKILAILSVILLWVAFLIIFIQVFARYLFHTGKPWMEELARYSVIWMVMFCSALAVRKGSHMKIDLLDQYLGKKSPKAVSILHIIFDIVMCLFFFVMIKAGVNYVNTTSSVTSAGLRISMAYAYAAIPVGFGVIGLYTIEDIWKNARVLANKSEEVTE